MSFSLSGGGVQLSGWAVDKIVNFIGILFLTSGGRTVVECWYICLTSLSSNRVSMVLYHVTNIESLAILCLNYHRLTTAEITSKCPLRRF